MSACNSLTGTASTLNQSGDGGPQEHIQTHVPDPLPAHRPAPHVG